MPQAWKESPTGEGLRACLIVSVSARARVRVCYCVEAEAVNIYRFLTLCSGVLGGWNPEGLGGEAGRGGGWRTGPAYKGLQRNKEFCLL